MAPIITIFVRHSAKCKYVGDEFTKRCNCRKHFRWSKDGVQFRRQSGTRSWAEAEEIKRRLESELSGAPSKPVAEEATLLATALEIFLRDKAGQGVTKGVVARHKQELSRFVAFSEGRGVFSVNRVTLPLLIDYRATWPERYTSSLTRAWVQKRLHGFLKFCEANGWITRPPRLSPITPDEPPTLPLTKDEYADILAAVPLEFPNGLGKRVRATIQIMRWSGLSVRDAITLRRDSLVKEATFYRVVTNRQKTGVHVSVPIPIAVAEEALAAGDHATYLLWQRDKEGTPDSAAHGATIAIRKVFTRAGIKTKGFMKSHRLRDTFAVDLLEKGVPLEEVSKLLGHESIKTTERSYAKWVKGRQDRLDSLVTESWVK